MAPPHSPSSRTRALVIAVGDWPAMPPGTDLLRTARMVVQRAPDDPRHLKRAIATLRPSWLLVGHSLEERTVRALVSAALTVRPELQVAMLGSTDDLQRCERWMRRGCHVYLDQTSDVPRVASALAAANGSRLQIVDRAFHDAACARRTQPVDNLTRREEEVLQLLRHGLRNADIADALHLTESTIEFHVSRLLAKLGARNRLEAVDHAIALGLS